MNSASNPTIWYMFDGTDDIEIGRFNVNTNVFTPKIPDNLNLPGNPTTTTQTAGNSSTKLATTACVTTADNLKADKASPTFTGTPTAPTAAAGTNTQQLATTAFVEAATSPAQLLTDIKTVDGENSGLDADFVKGKAIYTGSVSSSGTADGLPTGWTSAKTATGRYEVTHNTGTALRIVAFPKYQAGSIYPVMGFAFNTTSTTLLEVRFYKWADGLEVDASFNFVAFSV
jgi:hypothetical protein